MLLLKSCYSTLLIDCLKDYKHIHPVDYDEDYDDSDGGYSDFQHSGDEAELGEDQQHLKDDSVPDAECFGTFILCPT